VRREFNTAAEARTWEKRVLERLHVLTNDRWLNCSINSDWRNEPGYKLSEKTCQKRRGVRTEEHKRNIQEGMVGKTAWAGKTLTEEHRAKISTGLKLNPSMGMLGKKHSDDFKKKMSIRQSANPSFKGRSHTEESKAKMRATRAQRHFI
jgi:hypothetical protein